MGTRLTQITREDGVVQGYRISDGSFVPLERPSRDSRAATLRGLVSMQDVADRVNRARSTAGHPTYRAEKGALPADENGWARTKVSRNSAWYGDQQVGDSYEGVYLRDNGDGTYTQEIEGYYVEPAMDGYGEIAFTVNCRYTTSTATDPNDPGGTELSTEDEYDTLSNYYTDLDEAEKVCRGMAESDHRRWR